MNRPNGNQLDALILNQIIGLTFCCEEAVRRLEQGRGSLETTYAAGKPLQAMYKHKEREIQGLVRALPTASEETAACLREQIKTLYRDLEQLQEKTQVPDTPQQMVSPDRMQELAACLSDFGTVVRKMEREPQRMLLRELVSHVVWHGEAAELWLTGAEEPAENLDFPVMEPAEGCYGMREMGKLTPKTGNS